MRKFGKRKAVAGAGRDSPTPTHTETGAVTSPKGSKGVKVTVKQAVQDKAIDYIKVDNFEGLTELFLPHLKDMTSEESTESTEIKFLNKCHTKTGKTPLCVAAEEGRMGSIDILLEAKALLDLVDKNGMTAFLYAAKAGELEIMETLKGADADVHAKSQRSENAVVFASAHNFLEVIELCVSYQVALDDLTTDLQTALTVALKLEYFPICLYLLERQCDINVRGFNGDTALIRTAFDGRTQTAAFILEQGGSPMSRTSTGRRRS